MCTAMLRFSQYALTILKTHTKLDCHLIVDVVSPGGGGGGGGGVGGGGGGGGGLEVVGL